MSRQFKHACRYLRRNEKIADCLIVIERSAQLLREIRTALPAPLDEHCLHAVLDAGVLTLTSDSPVWSSRLRFFAPELERRLASHHGTISASRIRVQPGRIAPSPTPGVAPKHKLSSRTARHLTEAASAIDDAQLAAALRRLAKAGAEDR